MTDTLSLTIPIPPSVNGLYASLANGKRVKSKAYKQWLDEAGWFVLGQRRGAPTITGPVDIEILIRRPSGNSDVDNRVKATLDLLVKQHVISDDRYVHSVTARWADIPSCVVTIRKHVEAVA